ncbi:MAG TPA: TM0106 family RecB-like putative nuclease [Casimicrobiaceae bacterium]
MQTRNDTTLFSASDLVGFLECEHVTTLGLTDLVTPLPRAADDESALLVQQKGFAHEAQFLAALKGKGLRVAEMPEAGGPEDLARATRRAMAEGHDIVFQAAFLSGVLYGRADFLRRVERPSSLGAFGYEVIDTKLARSAKAKFAVQLAFYSDLLADAQGVEPQMMHLVLGDKTERSLRVANYSRYVRQARERFLAFVARHPNDTYPERCAHCLFCPWRDVCDTRWKADDHLNQVAGITRNQIVRLRAAGTRTVESLAGLADGKTVARLQSETVTKLRAQAALQLARRRTGEPRVELLELDPERRRGFYRLPEPDAGDVFFDMEGDPFEEQGLEYLFGLRFVEDGKPRFEAFWAHDRDAERVAFEALMDFLAERIRRFPRLHVYHYAHYEPSALKRLMSLHGTREAQMDDLLRRERFVDLYKVVREAIRTSEPGLSIKDIEIFYMPPRAGEVTTAGASIVHYERWKATQDPGELEKIRCYNEDDCRSTHLLRAWLLARRPAGLPWFSGEMEGGGAAGEGSASERIRQIEAGLARHRKALLGGLPGDRAAWGPEEKLRELIADLLDFHRRAAKPAWWAMYARQDMTQEELIDDIECLGALTQIADRPPVPVNRSLVYTFGFPEQETKLRFGDGCHRTDTTERLGEIVALDERARTIEIKVGRQRDVPPTLSIGPEGPIGIDVLREAVWRFADSVAAGDGRFAAVRALLRKDAPVLRGRAPGSTVLAGDGGLAGAALRAVAALDESYVFIQGPPGAGKTTTGSQLVLGLLEQGKRVGVTSNSHKAINNLLRAVEKGAQARGFAFTGVKKSSKQDPDSTFDGRLVEDVYTNAEVVEAGARLVAGTAWLFADRELEASLDYLFVDEAGQVALANLVAMGTAARNIVLLGDQMQLGQPIQGVHPGRSGESTLEYLLDGQATVAADRGIFLGTTWRMHEDVCRFISDAVYDGRLAPEPANQTQRLVLNGAAHEALMPTGIRFLALPHDGCKQKSEPEAAIVKALFDSLLAQSYFDKQGEERRMGLDNILVVAPYNAQVNLLKSMLPAGARVGTIDKFQGQEAEVVLVSMTTSSGDYLPRNLEFLYDRNRLNVAVSRAKCLAIVVASPELLHIRCSTPEQMELVNTLCWLREYADGMCARTS